MQIPDIEALIPQRSPMLFIESVRDWNEGAITAQGRVCEHWPLVDRGQAPGVCAFEFMTQTVAAHQALCALKAGQSASGIGVITGCRRLRVQRASLGVHTTFVVHAQQLWGDGPSGMYEAQVLVDDNIIADARFSVRQLSPSELGI